MQPVDKSDRNLLIGILAVQMDFISRDRLVEAMGAWVLDKSKSLDQILLASKAIDAGTRDLILALVDKHLELHQGDPQQSLAALSSLGASLREDLRSLADPQIEATLAIVGIHRATEQDSADLESTISLGQASNGVRFRILRPHAKGGLGKVSVALDQELHREVALKEIQEQHADHPDSRARFLLEAEVTGGLEHPGIVPVYGLGSYGNGRPFYAMRFIRGDSLKEAADQFHKIGVGKSNQSLQSLAFRQLLGRFVDVCQAMEYAHSRGVLHRDLKPGNIMLGKYGETLIVDWGLSKVIGRDDVHASSDEATLKPSSGSGAAPTLLGSAIGTPQYMSPEQAEGRLDQLGPGTDVYSLRATLYYLLTGRSPFDRPDVAEVLRQVRSGQITPPRQVNPGIPRALEAICLKAMSLRPADRYATAMELADDVERCLADEPVSCCVEPFSIRARRWIRRHPAMVSTSAACVVLGLCAALVVAYLQRAHATELAGKNIELTTAKNRAEAAAKAEGIAKEDAQNKQKLAETERTRAEQREQEAIDAVKRFGDAVAQNWALKNSEQLKSLRKELLKEPLAYFKSLRERLQADKDTRPESLARLANAAFDLGQLTDEIGDKQVAIAAYQEALAIRERLAREKPSVTEFQSDLASSHHNLGNLLSATGKPAEALAANVQAITIRERLARENPSVAQFHSDLAFSHHNLGNLFSATGQPAEALAAYEQAKTIRERLARENPSVNEFQSYLAKIYNSLGALLSQIGKPTETLAAFEQAKTIQEQLARENPFDIEIQSELAKIHFNLGILLSQTGKPAEALAANEQAITIQERLVRENPSVTEFQRDLAASHLSVGKVLHDTGKLAEALAAYERTKAIQERLTRENPSVTQFHSDLALSHHNLGFVLDETGKPAEALAAYEQALAIQERLARENPSVTQFQHDLALSHHNLGILFSATGKPTEAFAAYEQAITIRKPLARENPSVTQFQSDLALSHDTLGRLLRATGKPVEALAAYEQAKKIQEQLARENPSVTEFQSYLADTHNSLGILLSETGKPAEALAAFEEAKTIRERRARENPSINQFQNDLALSHNNLGILLINAGKPAEALAAFEEAKTIRERLARENPSVNEFQSNLASSHHNLGNLFGATGKPAEAWAAFEQSKTIRERLARENPTVTEFQHLLGMSLQNMAVIQRDAKRFAEARELIQLAIQHQQLALLANRRNPNYHQNLKVQFAVLHEVAAGLKDDQLAEIAERGLIELATSDPQFEELDARLAKVLAGEASKDTAELLAFGQRAYDLRRYDQSARFYREAIERDSTVTENRQAQVAYNAACSAALAASSKSIDEPPPVDAVKAELRTQALSCLKSELVQWEKAMEKLETRPVVGQTLKHWQGDSDLAGVREEAELANLPEDERVEWQGLWQRVGELLAKAAGPVETSAEPAK